MCDYTLNFLSDHSTSFHIGFGLNRKLEIAKKETAVEMCFFFGVVNMLEKNWTAANMGGENNKMWILNLFLCGPHILQNELHQCHDTCTIEYVKMAMDQWIRLKKSEEEVVLINK